MEPLKLLISHYHEEKGLAQAWATLLANVSSDAIKCWFSSDLAPKGGMEIGDEWREQIYAKLNDCRAVLAIQSPTSNGRPWVIWECGIASGVDKERGVIPIVFSMEKSGLTSPLASYQVYVGDDITSVREVCDRLMQMAVMRLRDEVFNLYYPTYNQSVLLHKPRRPVTREAFDLWLNRFDTMLESGRASEIPAKRDEMYASLPKPFVPQNAQVHEFLSRVMLDQRRFNEAISECKYGLVLVPEDIELLHRKALSLVEAGDPAEALSTLETLFSLNLDLKDNPELSTLEGRLHRERWNTTSDTSHLDSALICYVRAANSYPDQYYPCVNAGELCLFRGDRSAADFWFNKSLDICRNLSETRNASYWIDFTVAQSLVGLVRLSDASAAYKEAAKKRPSPRDKLSALNGAMRTARAAGISDNEMQEIKTLLS